MLLALFYQFISALMKMIQNASKSVPASTRLEDPSRKGTTRTAKSAPFNPCPLREVPYSTVFFGEPAHGPPHVAGGASGPIRGCRDESRTDNPDLDLRHVFDRNNRKTPHINAIAHPHTGCTNIVQP